MIFTHVTLLAISAALAPAMAQKSTSGNVLVEFECDSSTFPMGPVGDPPVLSFFSKYATVTLDGQNVTDVNCQPDPKNTKDGNLAYCVYSDSKFDDGSVSIHYTFDAIGGECAIDFGYKGVSYSTGGSGAGAQTDSCATQGCGVEPFSCDMHAKCYFDS